jgi:hypothetical protein
MPLHVADDPLTLTKALEALQHLLYRFVPPRSDFYQSKLLRYRQPTTDPATDLRPRSDGPYMLSHFIGVRQSRSLESSRYAHYTSAQVYHSPIIVHRMNRLRSASWLIPASRLLT